MRRPVIAGNWKMNKTISEAVETCRSLEQTVQDVDVDVIVCPPFTALSAICALAMNKVKLGAQNMSNVESGAYTGEVSIKMLHDVCCSYVIIGHSERRQLFGETDQFVNQKAHLALEYGLKPIICVGESLTQRQAGNTEQVVINQIKAAFGEIAEDQVNSIVVAYEPIWAIGTGETASPEDANVVITTIRDTITELYNPAVAAMVRIQYGGSVNPGNIQQLMAQPEIDGVLVGGASLDAKSFSQIVSYNK